MSAPNTPALAVTVLTGTQVRGCTHALKEQFLQQLRQRADCTLTEYVLPRDCPVFCLGCKTCFYHGIAACPHAQYTVPIWESLRQSDVVVFAAPAYAFHTPAQVKALLDHYAAKWMAHAPDREMFAKQGVILSQAVGAGMGKAAGDIRDSLLFWGVARIHTVKVAMRETDFALVSARNKKKIQAKLAAAAARVAAGAGAITPSFKTKAVFYGMRLAHRFIHRSLSKQGREATADYRYWQAQGWLGTQRPWRLPQTKPSA